MIGAPPRSPPLCLYFATIFGPSSSCCAQRSSCVCWKYRWNNNIWGAPQTRPWTWQVWWQSPALLRGCSQTRRKNICRDKGSSTGSKTHSDPNTERKHQRWRDLFSFVSPRFACDAIFCLPPPWTFVFHVSSWKWPSWIFSAVWERRTHIQEQGGGGCWTEAWTPPTPVEGCTYTLHLWCFVAVRKGWGRVISHTATRWRVFEMFVYWSPMFGSGEGARLRWSGRTWWLVRSNNTSSWWPHTKT